MQRVSACGCHGRSLRQKRSRRSQKRRYRGKKYHFITITKKFFFFKHHYTSTTKMSSYRRRKYNQRKTRSRQRTNSTYRSETPVGIPVNTPTEDTTPTHLVTIQLPSRKRLFMTREFSFSRPISTPATGVTEALALSFCTSEIVYDHITVSPSIDNHTIYIVNFFKEGNLYKPERVRKSNLTIYALQRVAIPV